MWQSGGKGGEYLIDGGVENGSSVISLVTESRLFTLILSYLTLLGCRLPNQVKTLIIKTLMYLHSLYVQLHSTTGCTSHCTTLVHVTLGFVSLE